ncbi:dodecin family protein [Tsukamurella sp. 8F]|uniref:dodecin n=1 Tax=unclassified Tsukamurella TaxID=2633480 RepID=UPI0023B8A12F|nr:MULTISPECIES: dodecin [unclassified Tsukamurella]MDF0528996.1 dodecin family protein [Tsukamurella sp. 8J]MDF0587369.1 dodecin family protein [Tsukamurella sp. 8F]
MTNHVYRQIEVVGSSPDGSDAAIANAIARASQTVRNLEWFEVVSTRGHIDDGRVGHTQVTLKIGFRMEE